MKTRGRGWARSVANHLTRAGVTPNAISMSSVVWSAAACAAFVGVTRAGPGGAVLLLAVTAVFIQLRLLANMLDGLVAVEGGRHTPAGDVFNDVPDRLDDVLILVGAGYAITWSSWASSLGWVAATLALLTAYIPVLGGSLGLRQDFCGPMAKSHRMAVLTAACAASIVEAATGNYHGYVVTAALVLISVGAGWTAARRVRRIVLQLDVR